MKKTKLIIPAIGMLLLSTAASITGTVAWFSMNTSVTATGMSVTAKSDSYFLEIAGSEDEGYSTTGTNNLDEDLYPTAHETLVALADIENVGKWYFQYSTSTSNASANLTTKTYLSTFAGYVATCTYSVRLNANSGQATAYDLYVSSVTIPANKGIRVIVAGTDGYSEFSTSATTIAPGDVLSEEVTKTAQDIKVYIYFDGNDANVYSDNVSNLKGEVEFTLAVLSTDAPAA